LKRQAETNVPTLVFFICVYVCYKLHLQTVAFVSDGHQTGCHSFTVVELAGMDSFLSRPCQ